MRSLGSWGALVALLVAIAGVQPVLQADAFVISPDWPQYLLGPSHSSATSAAVITTTRVAGLLPAWKFRSPGPTLGGQPHGGFVASPTVAGGKVFIGSNTGVFYALDQVTGQVQWQQFVGYVTAKTCGSRGVAATSAVAPDPATGAATVYVAGGDGMLRAFDATSGSVMWTSMIATPSTTVNDYYDWSSPTVANNLVYVGVSSQCDTPLVTGAGVKAFDQSTGALVAQYFSMPADTAGGSVWTSVAVDIAGSVFATVGNAAPGATTNLGDASSIVRLNGQTLAREDGWAIPIGARVADDDFDASPTVFTAKLGGVDTEMVGGCNKNGNFYAFKSADLSAGPVWSFRVGVGTENGVISCLAAAAFDGTSLLVGGNATTIGGIAYNGSVRKLDPTTGSVIWEAGLPGNILGSPSVNGAGVVAAALYTNLATNGTYLINSSDGSVLRFIQLGKEFSQPVFAGKYLLLATQGGTLNVFRPAK